MYHRDWKKAIFLNVTVFIYKIRKSFVNKIARAMQSREGRVALRDAIDTKATVKRATKTYILLYSIAANELKN